MSSCERRLLSLQGASIVAKICNLLRGRYRVAMLRVGRGTDWLHRTRDTKLRGSQKVREDRDRGEKALFCVLNRFTDSNK